MKKFYRIYKMGVIMMLCCVLLGILLLTGCHSHTSHPPFVDHKKAPYSKEELLSTIELACEAEKTIVGQQAMPGSNTVVDTVDAFYQGSGALPGVLGLHVNYNELKRLSEDDLEKVTSDAATYAKQGGIVTVFSPFSNPLGSGDFLGGDDKFDELITPGTELNDNFKKDLDAVAGFLKKLQNKGVPVLYRPLHESNGSWVWYSWIQKVDGKNVNLKPESFINMWIYVYEYLVYDYELDNLLFCFAPNASTIQGTSKFYPGDEYVDVVGMDWYAPKNYENSIFEVLNVYNALKETGKPFVWAELGFEKSTLSSRTSEDWLDLLAYLRDQGVKGGYALGWSGMWSFASMGKAAALKNSSLVACLEESKDFLDDSLDHVHNWSEVPQWNWNKMEATATFSCSDCGRIEMISTVGEVKEEGDCKKQTLYTASITFNEKKYTSSDFEAGYVHEGTATYTDANSHTIHCSKCSGTYLAEHKWVDPQGISGYKICAHEGCSAVKYTLNFGSIRTQHTTTSGIEKEPAASAVFSGPNSFLTAYEGKIGIEYIGEYLKLYETDLGNIAIEANANSTLQVLFGWGYENPTIGVTNSEFKFVEGEPGRDATISDEEGCYTIADCGEGSRGLVTFNLAEKDTYYLFTRTSAFIYGIELITSSEDVTSCNHDELEYWVNKIPTKLSAGSAVLVCKNCGGIIDEELENNSVALPIITQIGGSSSIPSENNWNYMVEHITNATSSFGSTDVLTYTLPNGQTISFVTALDPPGTVY